jgi:hypothetical protein
MAFREGPKRLVSASMLAIATGVAPRPTIPAARMPIRSRKAANIGRSGPDSPVLSQFCSGFAGLLAVRWGGVIRKSQCGRSGGAPQIRLFALRADPFARPRAFERISTHQTPTRLYLVNLVRLRLLVVFFGLAHD